ncbi:MAG: 1-deoxy-D-xylulose-5-phosphate reductoisomerase [bacterium]
MVILGSTGSIGLNTLAVIDEFEDDFEVIGLTTNKNISLLKKQILKYKPQLVAVMDENAAFLLKKELTNIKCEIFCGLKGLIQVATVKEAEIIISGISGASGLIPTFEAIKANKNIALANKETLVMAGKLIMNEVRKRGIKFFPIDSEHSAIMQCLLGESKTALKNIILTASGGPFLNYSKEQLFSVTPENAVKHPKWNMGVKISIDSATLLNKGLEVIEAHWLFDLDVEQIKVVIHPQSIIHSLIEYIDGTMFAQLSFPDMKIPIQYALFDQVRKANLFKKLNLLEISELTFKKPDLNKFPCLCYAYEAAKIGGTMPVVLNASGEISVKLFLEKKINFMEIPILIKKAMDKHKVIFNPCLEEILEVDKKTREEILGLK